MAKKYLDHNKKLIEAGKFYESVVNSTYICFVISVSDEGWKAQLPGGEQIVYRKNSEALVPIDVREYIDESFLEIRERKTQFIKSTLEQLARPEKPENIGGCGKRGIRGINLREVGRFEIQPSNQKGKEF